MKRTILAVITVLPIGLSYSVADAHCFRYWYYNYPQICGASYHAHVHTVAFSFPLPPVDHDRDIPLPDLNAVWGGAMDTDLELQLQRQKALRNLMEGK